MKPANKTHIYVKHRRTGKRCCSSGAPHRTIFNSLSNPCVSVKHYIIFLYQKATKANRKKKNDHENRLNAGTKHRKKQRCRWWRKKTWSCNNDEKTIFLQTAVNTLYDTMKNDIYRKMFRVFWLLFCIGNGKRDRTTNAFLCLKNQALKLRIFLSIFSNFNKIQRWIIYVFVSSL